MNAAEVKQRLNDRILEVCEHLLPGGRRNGHSYEIGDIHGTAGQSLKITLDGPHIGGFKDFSESEIKGSNLLELWRVVRGCDFKTALHEAKQWLGVADDEPWSRAGHQPKQSRLAPIGTGGKLRLEDQLHPVEEGSAVWKWLTETRGIAPETIRAYKIGQAHIKKDNRDCVVLPFYDASGRLCRLKYRDIWDKKYMFQAPKKLEADRYENGAELHLFGIQGVGNDDSSVVLVEGEIDAMSFHADGFAAVSLPIGAQANDTHDKCSHDEWIENDFSFLERFTEIYLALDADEPGQKATQLLIPRLGRERCYLTEFPAGLKDANECLLKGESLRWTVIETARGCDPAELKTAGFFSDDVWDRFYPPDGQPIGDELPWSIGGFRLRPGEVTVWHGYNGHGKSVTLGHVLVHLAGQGRKSCLASLEMPGAMLLQNMWRQTACIHKPANDDAGRQSFNDGMNFLDRFVYVFDFVGSAHSAQILDCWQYAAKKYGVSYFVIDSMMKLSDVNGTDYDAQKHLMNRLNVFAKDYAAHVILVCHSKKPPADRPKEKFPPGELDISGSSDVPNGAWNVICCWRNEMRQQKIEKFNQWINQGYRYAYDSRKRVEIRQELSDDDIDSLQAEVINALSEHHARIEIQKDRIGGIYPMPKNLWFDSESWQFGEENDFQPVRYLEQNNPAA